jgi:uncharacterized protein (TIGR02996 family)
MTDGQALLRAIIASPADDLPRLVYADWLDDTAEPANAARAELIRLQCRLEREGLPDEQAAAAWSRVKDLLRQHDRAWRGELPALPGVAFRRFGRGFVNEVRFVSGHRFQEHAGAVFAAAPVERLVIPAPYFVHGLLDSPHLEQVRELDLSGYGPSPTTVRELAGCSRLPRLRRLTLVARSGARFHDTRRVIDVWAANALVASPHLANLQALVLREPQVTPAGRALLHDHYGDRVQFRG